MHSEALQLIRNANTQLVLELQRGGNLSEGAGGNKDVNQNSLHMNGIDQGFVKSNALVTLNSHEDDNMSGSTSDSQSSIIYRGPSSNMGDTSADEGARSDAASAVSPIGGGPSKTPVTTVWSPFGASKVKTYKPVSFDVPSSRAISSRSSQSQSAAQVAPLSPLHVTGRSSQSVSSLPSFAAAPSGGKQVEESMDTSEQGRQPSRDSGVSSTSITFTSTQSAMSPTQGSTAHSEFTPSSSPKKVVWSPGQKPPSLNTELQEREVERELDRRQEESLKNMPTKWTPTGGGGGGSDPARREFRPVKLDTASNTPPRVRKASNEPSPPGPEESFAWKPSDHTISSPIAIATSATTRTSSTSSPSNTRFSAWNGTSHFMERKSSLPPSQSPTVTLLQKDRGEKQDFEIPTGIRTVRVNEDEIPKGAILIGTKETHEEDKRHTDTYYILPAEGTTTTTRKVEVKKAPVYRDIGPTDEQTGMPVGLRSQIEKKKQKDWYKKMYTSLHRTDKRMEKGSSDVLSGSEDGHRQESNAYKPTYVFPENMDEDNQEAPNPYRPSYEFPSGASNVSSRDSSTMSLDRYGRLKSPSPKREVKRSWSPPHAKYRSAVYKNQPRSIIDYEPGHSSIADRESKLRDPAPTENNSAIYNPPVEKPGQYSRYVESDSELEYHRRDRPLSPCSDVPSRDLYKKVQQGGDIPYTGFGYPSQEKKGDPTKARSPALHVSPSQKSPTVTNKQHLCHVGSLSRRGTGFSSSTDRNNNALFKGSRSRSLSASEQLGVISQLPPKRQPNCETTYGENRERGGGYATLQTPGRQAARSRFSDSDVRSFTLDRRRCTAEETRRRRDEDDARRREKLQRLYAEEKRKKLGEEMRANEARRHNDFFTDEKYWLKLAGVEEKEASASQKSPIPKDRFEEVLDAASLERPKKKSVTKIRGKAKALYSFRAQNPRELSFRRGDTLFLLRAIDRNWYEGEHHGRVGIFPVNYVEVTTSLDEARSAAHQREGNAIAKYNFKAQSPIELSLRVGDEVSVIRQLDDNWLEGRIGHRQGIFPFNYVDIINEPDTPLMTPQLTPRSSYACTPRTGSPGQLSPVSTMSNGPAPTIPSAPISPRMFDFDFDQQSNFSPRSVASSTQNSYQREYIPSPSPSLQQRTQRSYGLLQESMNQARSPQPINQARSPQPMGKQQAPQRMQNNYGTYRTPDTVTMNGSYSQKDSRLISSQSPDRRVYGYKEPERQAPVYKGSGPTSTQFVQQQKSRVTEASPHNSRDGLARRYKEPIYPPFRSIYNYKPQNEDELELKDGDIVYVMEKCDDGWYVGTSDRTKEFGTFPGNYVKPI